MSVLDNIDALLPGLAWEHIESKPPPSPEDFRIVRGDFNELRGRFVEIFELGSKTLGFLGAILNLARRQDATAWSDGSTRSLKALLKKPAANREFVLQEVPFTHTLYDAVPRSTRNAFGHYAVEYDFSAGELLGVDGARESFVLFLVEYLQAARLCAYLFGVVEKITLDLVDADSPHRQVAANE